MSYDREKYDREEFAGPSYQASLNKTPMKGDTGVFHLVRFKSDYPSDGEGIVIHRDETRPWPENNGPSVHWENPTQRDEVYEIWFKNHKGYAWRVPPEPFYVAPNLGLLELLLRERLPKTDCYIYETYEAFRDQPYWPDKTEDDDETFAYRTNGQGSLTDMKAFADEVFKDVGDGITTDIEDVPFLNIILETRQEYMTRNTDTTYPKHPGVNWYTLWVGKYRNKKKMDSDED